MEQLQNLWSIAYGFRRQLATWGLFLVAALLGVHVIFGTNGWMAYEQKKSEYRKVTQEVQQMQQKNEQVQKEIKDLQSNPEAIKKLAREQLKYTRTGEVVFYLPGPKQEVTSTAQAQNEPSKK